MNSKKLSAQLRRSCQRWRGFAVGLFLIFSFGLTGAAFMALLFGGPWGWVAVFAALSGGAAIMAERRADSQLSRALAAEVIERGIDFDVRSAA